MIAGDNSMYTVNSEEEKKIRGRNTILPVDVDDDDSNNEAPDHDFSAHFDPEKINIIVKQPTVYNLIQRMSATPSEIDMNTSFQRHSGLWNKTDQSRLIESLLLRIPLPTFYFDGSDDNKWLIVDGLQRLSTFKAFMVDKELRLTDLEYFTEFNGLKFDELPKNMIRRIEETQIIANIIQPGTPDEVKFNIFKRINTGGFNLNSQEIRHAIFHGQASDFIEKLADSDAFKQFHISNKRMLDQELVTRFVAFYILKPENYRPRMDDFLEVAMQRLRDMSVIDLRIISSHFETAMERAFSLFENKAFKRQKLGEKIQGGSKVNKAMFETWSVELSHLVDSEFEILVKDKSFKEKYNKLLDDEKFIESVSQGTGHRENVQFRFTTVKKLIRECLI